MTKHVGRKEKRFESERKHERCLSGNEGKRSSLDSLNKIGRESRRKRVSAEENAKCPVKKNNNKIKKTKGKGGNNISYFSPVGEEEHKHVSVHSVQY